MSINYEYLFSQIDKAKKKQKKGYIPWNSPEGRKKREQHEKDQADKKRRNEEFIAGHSSPGKKFVSEKLTRVAGKKRAGGKYNVGTEKETRDTNRMSARNASGKRTGGTRGTGNLKRLKDIEDKKEKEAVREKIESQTSQHKRAVSDYKQYGRSGGKDDKTVSAVDHNARISWAMRRAQEKKRNEDNAAKRRATPKYVASIGPGETSAEYKKRTDKKREKKEQAKQKKQTKQQAADAKEEAYDYEKDESEGKSGTYDPDVDIYSTDEDKGDYKNASVWKSWLEKKERQFKEHKCTNCGETKPEVLFTNPLGKPKGICDQCSSAPNPKWLKELERDGLDEKGTPTTTRKSEEGKCANPNCDKESTITYHLGTTTGGKIDDNIKTIKVCPGCAKEIDDFASETGGKTYKIPKYDEDKLKAEEGIGGMNMGSQRGLGHEAGYKQDPGQSAQITEVVEEEIGNESKKKSHKCPECESKDIVSGQHKSKKEKRGHNTKICDDCGHEWEKKSANENHEQDEGPEVKPNKNQIPASKPGMDVIRSMYKKALITKYNNIYKPANL